MSKTIKVIDLLNKIANGEEVPKKIDYEGKIFEYDELEKCYVTSNFDNTVMQGLDLYIDGLKQYCLNLEVEIIEEEPEIDIQNLTKKSINYVVCRADFNDGQIIKILNEFFSRNQEYIDCLLESVKQLDNQINNK